MHLQEFYTSCSSQTLNNYWHYWYFAEKAKYLRCCRTFQCGRRHLVVTFVEGRSEPFCYESQIIYLNYENVLFSRQKLPIAT